MSGSPWKSPTVPAPSPSCIRVPFQLVQHPGATLLCCRFNRLISKPQMERPWNFELCLYTAAGWIFPRLPRNHVHLPYNISIVPIVHTWVQVTCHQNFNNGKVFAILRLCWSASNWWIPFSSHTKYSRAALQDSQKPRQAVDLASKEQKEFMKFKTIFSSGKTMDRPSKSRPCC